MSTGLLLQYIVVVLIVLVSAWVVLKKQFPGTVRKARGAKMPESFWTDPLVYQGGSDDFLPPTADAPFGS